MRKGLAGLVLGTLIVGGAFAAPVAAAKKLPVYRDPPSFKGRAKVPAYKVVDPPPPPASRPTWS